MEAIAQEIRTRVGNLEASMTIRGSDGQERPLVQSFVNLEARVLQQQTSSNMEDIERLIDAKLKSAIVAMQPNERQPHAKHNFAKPILESKAIQDVGKVTDAKRYQQWNKKMKNALEQTREQSRGMLEVVEKMSEEEVIQHNVNNDGFTCGESIIELMMVKSGTADEEKEWWKGIAKTLNRDMWAILCSKAESEAEETMDGCNQGEGLWAYLRIHLWFMRTTAQGRSVRRAAIMNPARCKHEHEISGAIERWEERCRNVQKDDKELELPDSWKMTALHGILCGEIQKNVEYREKEFSTYDELRSTVMRWAINKKIEKERHTRGDPMDTNQAEDAYTAEEWVQWESNDCQWPTEETDENVWILIKMTMIMLENKMGCPY